MKVNIRPCQIVKKLINFNREERKENDKYNG